MAQILTRRMGQISLVIVARLRAHLFHKQFTDFLLLDMDGRHHDVTGFLMHQLKNSFSQITFHHVNSFLNQIFIQSAFFGQHRFTLDKAMHIVSVQNIIDYGTILIGIFRPIHMGSICLCVLFELLQKQIQVTVAVHLDSRSHVAQLFPFRYLPANPISFGTHHPQGLVMPSRQFLIFLKLFGGF